VYGISVELRINLSVDIIFVIYIIPGFTTAYYGESDWPRVDPTPEELFHKLRRQIELATDESRDPVKSVARSCSSAPILNVSYSVTMIRV
jgi:hypothetical protein